MKKYLPILILLLLLTACQGEPGASVPTPTPAPVPAPTSTPTPEPTPTPTPKPTALGIELDVGDGEHKFWVELTGEGEARRVNIYEKQGDTQPLQTFADGEYSVDLGMADLTAEDVNFDGFMDFHFYTSFGYSIVSHSSYYVWDPEGGCFVPAPYGLNELSTAEFLPYTKEVSSLSRGPMGTAITSYHYEDGKLVQTGASFDPEPDSDWKAYTAHKIKVDQDHIFWVEITQREELEGEENGTPILVSIYEESSRELKQSLEDTIWLHGLDGTEPYAQDVNFDGYADLGYRSWAGGSYAGSDYWVWDPKTEKFVRDPYGLEDLSLPEFDQERQVIETWNHSGASYTIEFYRYIDGKLTCVRRLRNQDNYSDDFTATLTVENYNEKAGELKEVYREENAKIGGVTYAFTEEFQRWHNIDYLPVRQEVKVDENHTFWVELVDTGEPEADSNKLLVNIYRDETGKELFQTFESWWADPHGLYCFPVEDMDFDGYMDFSVCNIEYRSHHRKSHYIWDEKQEKFVEDPYGLNDLNNTRFDEERQVVRANWGSVTGETVEYYQYRQGALVCIRLLDHEYWSEDHTMRLKVEDEVDGVLTTVYEEKIPLGELPEGELWTEEFERWYDLDYPGQ